VTRYAWDLADRSASRWAVPLGSAGNPEDEHFADQLPLWATCRMAPVVTDWAELQPEEI
jgi:penicillin G amidase